MEIKECDCYNFRYELIRSSKDLTDTFVVTLKAVAKDKYEAKNIIENWLETDGHKSFRYVTWTGWDFMPMEMVLCKE